MIAGKYVKTFFVRYFNLKYKRVDRIGRTPSQIIQDSSPKLKHKAKIHRQWNQGYTFWGDCKDMAWKHWERIRKSKAQLELDLSRDVKNNMKGFFRTSKENERNCNCTLFWQAGGLAKTDTKKAEVLSNFFLGLQQQVLQTHRIHRIQDLMRFIQGSWRNWQMKLLSHYPSRLKSCAGLVKVPLKWGNLTLFFFLIKKREW